MSNKFNTNALAEYSRAYARRVANDFYQQHTVITGKQILNLTPIAQVNLFVVNSLFEKWKADVEKFRSPYFDYAHPEVEESLRSFMNVVSQHIAVRREHLEPLLADAARRTLCLLFDPRGYFDEIFRELPEFTFTASAAKQLTRFTQIHKIIPATIEQRMNGKPFVYTNQALNYLDEVLAHHSHELDRYDKFVSMFTATVPLDLGVLLRSHVPDQLVNAPARSFFDDSLDPVEPGPMQTIIAIAPSDSPKNTADSINLPPDTTGDSPDSESLGRILFSDGTSAGDFVGGTHFLNDRQPGAGPEPVAPTAQPMQNDDVPTAIGLRFSAEPEPAGPVTLNDRLREAAVPAQADAPVVTSVAEAFHRAPVESVNKSISLNQKFRFINQLFNGHSMAYAQAMAELDTMPNYGQALDLISYRYASQYLWDMSSDEVSELVEILKRRFA